MKSPYLTDFLNNVGDSVHSINTNCVGLSSIESGNYTKPSSLTISWSTSDNILSARKARIFNLKAALVFLDDAFSCYLKDIRSLSNNEFLTSILSRKNPQFINELSKEFKEKYNKLFILFNSRNKNVNSDELIKREYKNIDSSDRIRALDHFFKFEFKYWIPCALLLTKWRNKVVHRKSKAKLEPSEIKILRDNSETLKTNHAGIDIEKTLNHFDSNEITLKDITTLIAITIKMAREIDKQIYKSINKIDIIEYYVKDRRLVEDYNKIVEIKNPEIRKRKFANFIITNIALLETIEINYLYGDLRFIKEDECE